MKERSQLRQTLRERAPGVGPRVVERRRRCIARAPCSARASRMCQEPFSGTYPWGSPMKEWEHDRQTLRECAPGLGSGVVKTPSGYLPPAPRCGLTSGMCQKPFSGEKGSSHVPQGQRRTSGPQFREGPWVKYPSRQHFDFFRVSRAQGKQGQGRNPSKIQSRRRGSPSPAVVGDMFPTSEPKTACLYPQVERSYRPSKFGGRTSPFLPPKFQQGPWSISP